MNVRVRIAPSPTGEPHIGTAYVALFNYVFAKKHGGKFIIRIEDTDRTRYRKESENAILDSLKWLGFTWDEGPDIGGPFRPYRQSERIKIYHEWVKKLIENDLAYYCFCDEERLKALRSSASSYDRLCRTISKEEAFKRVNNDEPHVIRFKTPLQGKVSVLDELRGVLEFNAEIIDDFIIIKSDGFPTYHLANVIDDHLMEISHVIRGEEWISSLPKHVLLYKAFGWNEPKFIHLNLLRNSDRSKVSKRKNPTSILYYKRKGVTPDALKNFLALMGWNPGENKEIFNIDEMIEKFEWKAFNLGGPVFDLEKLKWLNGQYLKSLCAEEWLKLLKNTILSDSYLIDVINLYKERVELLEDFFSKSIAFFSGDLEYSAETLIPKNRKKEEVILWFNDIREKLEALDEWNINKIKNAIEEYGIDKGLKKSELFMAIRVSITGSKASAGLFETLQVIGRPMVLRRLHMAAKYIKELKI